MKKVFVPLLAAMLTAGCYHAVIDTGRAPSPQIIQKKWANSFIIGLVPPPIVQTASQCPNGVAKVETQHSFLNGLVAALTWSIYTPMEITVTCAAAGGRDDSPLPTITAGADKAAAIQKAAELSAKKDTPVLVKF
jgi:hypothetical protein